MTIVSLSTPAWVVQAPLLLSTTSQFTPGSDDTLMAILTPSVQRRFRLTAMEKMELVMMLRSKS